MHDLPVHAGRLGGKVPLQSLQGEIEHLPRRHAGIDLQQTKRRVETIQVMFQAKRLPPERPRHLEGHVSEHEGRVENRDPSLGLRHELTIEIDDSS